jgi:DNA replication protein DnaC
VRLGGDCDQPTLQQWGAVFPDPRLVAAIVDRVTFNAHIIATSTKSYRLRTSKTTTRTKRAT